ncbi:MAG: serine/threonine protein kinase [Candidatus Eremiobacterota bacterium]
MADPTEYFYDLTPDRIFAAFDQAGLRVEPTLTFLNSMENRVVRAEDEHGTRWVGKFYRPGRWTRQALREEHAFLFELQEAGLPVGPPLRLEDGDTVGTVAGIYFALFPFQFGRCPDEVLLEHVHVLGDMLARVHEVGERSRTRHRPIIGPRCWGLDSLSVLQEENVVPPDLWSRYERTVLRLVERVERLFAQARPIRLHGDLHRGNLLWSSAGLSLVDFDDFGMGPPVQDVWLLLPGRDEDSVELREIMLDVYQRRRPFDRRSLALIEPLRALKFVRYAAWVARRRNDPIFRRVFPDVESRSFWRREAEELEAQLEHLG